MKLNENFPCGNSFLPESFKLFSNSSILHNNGMDFLGTVENHLSMDFKRAFENSTYFTNKSFPSICISNLIIEEQVKVFYDKMIEFEEGDKQVEFPLFLQSKGLLTLNQVGIMFQ